MAAASAVSCLLPRGNEHAVAASGAPMHTLQDRELAPALGRKTLHR
jgi:hypothetical protein